MLVSSNWWALVTPMELAFKNLVETTEISAVPTFNVPPITALIYLTSVSNTCGFLLWSAFMKLVIEFMRHMNAVCGPSTCKLFGSYAAVVSLTIS